MAKPIHVAVIYNEPTVETEDGRKFVIETGMHHEQNGSWMSKAISNRKECAIFAREIVKINIKIFIHSHSYAYGKQNAKEPALSNTAAHRS